MALVMVTGRNFLLCYDWIGLPEKIGSNDQVLVIPTATNFPVLDSLAHFNLNWIGIQCTVSNLTVSMKLSLKLAPLRKYILDPMSLTHTPIYFAVPDFNYSNFEVEQVGSLPISYRPTEW